MSRENQVLWTYSKKKKINAKNTYQRHLKIGVVYFTWERFQKPGQSSVGDSLE
jgi:hypothetical protein